MGFALDENIDSLKDIVNYDLTGVSYLEFGGSGGSVNLRDLIGIEHFPNLNEFICKRNKYPNFDISNIYVCSKLTSVTLLYSNITSLGGTEEITNPDGTKTIIKTGLAGLAEVQKNGPVHLKNLDLSNNNITNLDALEELTGLVTLNLENNAIQDGVGYSNIQVLADLNSANLKYLYLEGNGNITSYDKIKNLTWLGKSGF